MARALEADGPDGERLILEEGEAPGAVFDCRRPRGAALSRTDRDRVRPPAPGSGLGGELAQAGRGPGPGGNMPDGGTLRQPVRLGPGTWDISIRYFSHVDLMLRAGQPDTLAARANLGDRASFVSAGRLSTPGGRIAIEVSTDKPPRLSVDRTYCSAPWPPRGWTIRGRLVP